MRIGDTVVVTSGPLQGRVGIIAHQLRAEDAFVVAFSGMERVIPQEALVVLK